MLNCNTMEEIDLFIDSSSEENILEKEIKRWQSKLSIIMIVIIKNDDTKIRRHTKGEKCLGWTS